MRDKILVHVCCGFCGFSATAELKESYPPAQDSAAHEKTSLKPVSCSGGFQRPDEISDVPALNQRRFNLIFFWYNPNIYPVEECLKRKEALLKWAEIEGKEVVVKDSDEKKWFEKTGKIKDNENLRCRQCYFIRLEETVKTAKEKGIKYFTTTLLVSPYQKHEEIKSVCAELSEKYGIKFHYYDARNKYFENRDKYRRLGLYFQKYCGCIYSEEVREKELTEKNKRKK